MAFFERRLAVGKYEPLQTHLAGRGADFVSMSFAEIESIIGAPLPPSARKHRAWWSNNPSNSVITYAWLAAGYRTEQVDIASEKLVFHKADTPPNGPPPASTGEITAHPLFGALAGQITIPDSTDLTAPTGARWEADEE
jgi:hypothetical protein